MLAHDRAKSVTVREVGDHVGEYDDDGDEENDAEHDGGVPGPVEVGVQATSARRRL